MCKYDHHTTFTISYEELKLNGFKLSLIEDLIDTKAELAAKSTKIYIKEFLDQHLTTEP